MRHTPLFVIGLLVLGSSGVQGAAALYCPMEQRVFTSCCCPDDSAIAIDAGDRLSAQCCCDQKIVRHTQRLGAGVEHQAPRLEAPEWPATVSLLPAASPIPDPDLAAIVGARGPPVGAENRLYIRLCSYLI
jgi:hypothetical protein